MGNGKDKLGKGKGGRGPGGCMVDAYAKEKENSTTSSTPYNMHEEKLKKSLRNLMFEILWSKRKACEENLTNSVCVCSRRGNCGREINSKQ